MTKTQTATGAFDDIVHSNEPHSPASISADETKARAMYPNMVETMEREASGKAFPLMTKQRADAEERSKAEFDLTMTGTKGAEIRAANRARLEEISRAAILYPSQGEQLQAEADALLDKFEREDGTNWLDVE